MQKLFRKWVQSNKIKVSLKTDKVFEVKGLGTCLLLDIKTSRGREVILQDNHLLLSDSEIDILENQEINNVVFQFGEKFYYTKAEPNNDGNIEYEFKEFRYIGETSEQETEYINLGVHENYELLNGNFSADRWVAKAKFLRMKSLGIISKNTLSGTIPFQSACIKGGIKPIIGETITICYNYLKQEKQYKKDFPEDTNLEDFVPETSEAILYVKNEDGWRNLLRINYHINVLNVEGIGEGESTYIRWEDLRQMSDGLIFVFNNFSILNWCLDNNQYDKYDYWISTHKKYFSQVYYQWDSVRYYNEETDLRFLGYKQYYLENHFNDLKPVLITDTYFLEKTQSDLRRIVNTIDRKQEYRSDEMYFKTYRQYKATLKPLFKDGDTRLNKVIGVGLKNVRLIEKLCNYTIETGVAHIPRFQSGKKMSNKSYMEALAWKGLKQKEKNKKRYKQAEKRLQTELDLILKAGLEDYFLIQWDLVKWSKENNILVGTGRGSVVGSMLAYALDITTVNPLDYDLLFERFLNETRITPPKEVVTIKGGKEKVYLEYEEVNGKKATELTTDDGFDKVEIRIGKMRADQLPDVDIDYEDRYRDKVKAYMEERYGIENVCSVGTYGRLKIRSSMKDIGRVLGLDFQRVNFITKEFSDKDKSNFETLVNVATEKSNVKSFLKSNPKLMETLELTLNSPKSMGIHASAVLILPDYYKEETEMKIYDWIPVRKIGDLLVSEWEGKYIDSKGLLKNDVLGLSQLTKFHMMIDLIKQQEKEEIVLEDIPINDKGVYTYFQHGWNEDVFQFNSPGLKAFSIQVQPDNIEDLIAMNALFRPGPMGSKSHEKFAKIKHGDLEPAYDHPIEEKVTSDTFGLYVYQEQIMRAINVIGGMSLIEADNIRTVMKKFLKDEMDKYEKKFILGAKKNGVPIDIAKVIWSKLYSFSSYGFNKCISGDTVIYRFTGNQHLPKEITVKELYDKYHSKKSLYGKFNRQGNWGLIRRYNTETKHIDYGVVEKIHQNGVKKLYEVTLENGMKIKVTDNHRLMLSDESYVKLMDLNVGDVLMTCGGKVPPKGYKKNGLGKGWNKEENTKGKRTKNGKPFLHLENKKFKISKGIALKRSCGYCENKCGKNIKTDTEERFEYHHVDGDRNNNVPQNVIFVCNSCHKKLDYDILKRTGYRSKGYFAETSKIISIEFVGEEMTYDVEMRDNPHNFVANGIVSHNSHATAYTIMSYRSMWFKVHYPLQFYTVSLQLATEREVPLFISEIDRIGLDIKVIPIDINKSQRGFTCDPTTNEIYSSVDKVKGVGFAAVQEIVDKREQFGEYKNLDHFVNLIEKRKVNKGKIITLILAGAFDNIEGINKPKERYKLLTRYLKEYGSKEDIDKYSSLPYYDLWYIRKQKDLTGLGDIDFSETIQNIVDEPDDYLPPNDFFNKTFNKYSKDTHIICGEIKYIDVRPYKQKEGELCRITLMNNNDRIDGILWDDYYQKVKDSLQIGKVIAIRAMVKFDDFNQKNKFFSSGDSEIWEITY